MADTKILLVEDEKKIAETLRKGLSEQHYDVDVAYEGAISKERFFVIVNRNSSLSAVLKALQANDVQFDINGKKLTVRANK